MNSHKTLGSKGQCLPQVNSHKTLGSMGQCLPQVNKHKIWVLRENVGLK